VKKAWRLPVAILLLLVLLGGLFLVVKWRIGERFVDAGQTSIAPGQTATLEPNFPIGQTFVAHHGGLNGLEIYLSPTSEAQGALVLHLRESPLSTVDILTTTIPMPAMGPEGFYHFPFPPILSSHTHYYYAYLELRGSGQIEAPLGELNAYLDGTFYSDHMPRESQLVFRLTYNPASVVLDLALMVASWVAYGLAGLAILFFAGYWLVRRWALKVGLDFTAVLIASTLGALAAWMVFLVWAGTILRLNALTVQLIVGASCLVGILQFVRDRRQWRRREYWLGQSPPATLALWLVILLSIALRLFAGRGMVMLPGSDTYHHTLIVQLFEEQGGIPHSYQPYAPLISFSYHFGFHSIVALFRWLFGTELLMTTKSLALLLNGAVAAAVGLVSERWAGNRRAGVIAAATVGLVAVSPFCLLRWGRFTQTTGLLYLAAGLLALTAVLEGAGLLFPSLLVAAMLASHYRVFSLWILFAIVAGGLGILQRRWLDARHWLILGVVAVALVAPWLLRVAWVQYDYQGLRTLSPALEGAESLERLGVPVLSFITNTPLLLTSGLLALFVLVRKSERAMGQALVVWGLLLAGRGFILPAPGLIGALFDPITAILSLVVPIGILAGLSGELLWSALRGRGRFLVRAVVVVATITAMTVGLWHLPRLMYEDTFFYLRPADLVATDWIKDHTPEDARFLVNNIEIEWAPGSVVGIDSGYWIPLLTHRASAVPPMIYSFEWGDPAELPAALEASRRFSREKLDATALGEIVKKYGITHIFLNAQHLLLIPSEIAKNAGLSEIYRQDWVQTLEAVR
jgi:hypothetical protein